MFAASGAWGWSSAALPGRVSRARAAFDVVAGPVSLKPAVMIQIPLIPFSLHWSIVDNTNLALTTMIAKSTSPGTSKTEV